MITYPINKRTYLIKPLRITVIVRSMKKASDKAIGHAPQLIGALEKHAANTAVNTPNPPANPTANSSTPHPLPRTSREDTQVPHQSTSTAPSQHESPTRELLASLVPGIKIGKVDSIQQRYDQTASLEVSGKSHTQSTTSTSNLNDTADRQSTPGLDQFFKVSVPSRNPVENPSPNNSSTSSGLDTSMSPVDPSSQTSSPSFEKSSNSESNNNYYVGAPISGMSSSSGFSATGPLGSATQVSKTTLNPISTQPVPNTHIRGAVRTVNQPEVLTANADPQAKHNNPVIVKGKKVFRHKEAHRQECQSNPNCKYQDCPVLCGPPGDRDAVAHFTTNKNPLLESGKQNHHGSNTDLNNKPGYQGVVTYDVSHSTAITSEHIPGTQKLNNEPSLKQIILTHEDKK